MWHGGESDLGYPASGMVRAEGGDNGWGAMGGEEVEKGGDSFAAMMSEHEGWGRDRHSFEMGKLTWQVCLCQSVAALCPPWPHLPKIGSSPGTLCSPHKAFLSRDRPRCSPRALGHPMPRPAPPLSALLSSVAREKLKRFTPSAETLASVPLLACLCLHSSGEMGSNKKSYQLYSFSWFLPAST